MASASLLWGDAGSFEFPIQNDPVELWTTIAGDASGSDLLRVNAARTSSR